MVGELRRQRMSSRGRPPSVINEDQVNKKKIYIIRNGHSGKVQGENLKTRFVYA